MSDWMALPEVAARLGLTYRAALRWAREGRLHAELRRGPEGAEYYVPESQAEALSQTHAAGRVDLDGGTIEDVIAGMDALLATQAETLAGALGELRARLVEAAQTQEEREAALREELRQIRAELAAGIAALQTAVPVDETPRRPWWRLWSAAASRRAPDP